jgi:hypothetical protein
MWSAKQLTTAASTRRRNSKGSLKIETAWRDTRQLRPAATILIAAGGCGRTAPDSVTGVSAYRDSASKQLTNQLTFGDNPSGEVFYGELVLFAGINHGQHDRRRRIHVEVDRVSRDARSQGLL